MLRRPAQWILLTLATAFATGAAEAPAIPAAGLVAPVAAPLPFFYDLYTFRGEADARGRRVTNVVAAFAVPAGHLEREVRGAEVRYRFDVTLVVADTARRVVYRTDDSVYVGLRRPLSGDHLLFTHVQVTAPPSRSTVQRVIMTDATTPGIGQLYSSPFMVPDYSGSHLMLSDLALGRPSTGGGGWRRGDVALELFPTSQFPESAFEVFYEIYNLPAGHAYTTTVTVERVDAATGAPVPGSAVSVRYGDVARGRDGVLQELRRVEASVGRGDHRITVSIRDDGTGRTASRSRRFHVRGWAPGATLVNALPWKTPPAGPR